MKITYVTIVTFASDRAMSQQMPALESDAVQATNKYLGVIKKEFHEGAGRSLKTTVKSVQPSVEIVNLQPHISPKRTGYFRYITFLEID